MEAKNDIVQELTDLESPLAGFPRTTPFAAPESGFELNALHLTEGVFAALQEQDVPLPFPKAMPFEVPAAYFNQLADELSEAALSSSEVLSKETAFEVPGHYFEQFPGHILDKVKAAPAEPQPARKLIAFPARRTASLAAAAILLLGLGLGSSHLFRVPGRQASVEEALSGIPSSTISDYVQSNIDDFDGELIENAAVVAINQTNVSSLDNKDIVGYLNDEGWQ